MSTFFLAISHGRYPNFGILSRFLHLLMKSRRILLSLFHNIEEAKRQLVKNQLRNQLYSVRIELSEVMKLSMKIFPLCVFTVFHARVRYCSAYVISSLESRPSVAFSRLNVVLTVCSQRSVRRARSVFSFTVENRKVFEWLSEQASKKFTCK